MIDGSGGATTVSGGRAEDVLAWFQALIANAPQGMAVLDSDLRYVLVNKALTVINGFPAEEHLGREIAEVFPTYADLLVPLMRKVISTGEPVRGLPVRGETPAQPGVERSWEVDVYPVDAPGGTRLGVALGVTETTRAQRQRERLAQLQALSAALAGAATVEHVASVVADHTMPQVGAHETSLVVVGGDRQRLVRYRGDEVVESPLELDDSPAASAIRDGRRQFVGDDGDEDTPRAVAYPLITPSGTIGALEWRWRNGHALDDGDAVLATAAGLCAAAVERTRRADIRRELAVSFQRSLLPTALPDVADLDLAVRYRPSVREAHAGGDWYDAFPLSDGSVVLVVGDVIGHSASSAAIMSELRHSLRTMLFVLGDPAAALCKVNAMLSHVTPEPEVMATVAAVRFEPDRQRCCFALAGHPPPLIVAPDGQVDRVPDAAGALLGAHLSVPYRNASVALPTGATLALYTDGVIERRGEDLDRGIARLSRALATIAGDEPLAVGARRVMEAVEDKAHNDDAALLLARRRMPR